MNSGVLLMRNTDWMRDLFGQMGHYGTHPMNLSREEVCSPEDAILLLSSMTKIAALTS